MTSAAESTTRRGKPRRGGATLPRALCGALALCLCAGLSAPLAHAQPRGFWVLGDNFPQAVSADGLTVGGQTAARTGFTWTREGGAQPFEPGPGTAAFPVALGGDGSIKAGLYFTSTTQSAFRKLGSGSIENLGVLPGHFSSGANGVSRDGRVVVGSSTRRVTSQINRSSAFYWTPQEGMVRIPYLRPDYDQNLATAVSTDGGTIVGFGGGGGATEAFVLRGGVQSVLTLPGGGTLFGTANAVSGDGRWVVGGGGSTSAVRWDTLTGTAIELPAILAAQGPATGVSDNGRTVVGWGNNRAYVWREGLGTVYAEDWLRMNGVDVPTGTIRYLRAVSADGRTVCGFMETSPTAGFGFVATIPSPATALALIGITLAVSRRRR